MLLLNLIAPGSVLVGLPILGSLGRFIEKQSLIVNSLQMGLQEYKLLIRKILKRTNW
jgi:hypothetical protein